MFTTEASIFVNRPQQEVFDFVSNPANTHAWQDNMESLEWTSEGPVGVGSTQRAVTRFLGRDVDATVEFVTWDPPNQFGWKVASGPIPVEATSTFEARDNGTQLTMCAQVEAGGFFRIAEPLVKKQLEKQHETNMAALKSLLENGSA